MPDTWQAQTHAAAAAAAAPSQPNGDVAEALWLLKIDENRDRGGGVAQSNVYPYRPGEADCIYYLRTGLCGYGTNCRFNHPKYAPQVVAQYSAELPERAGQPDCGYYMKTGTCKYGSTCKFHHPRDRRGAGPVLFNVLGLPMHQEEKPCPYYMRTGSCKFGPACKFHHPQPPSLGTSLPACGLSGSTVVPSAGVPYSGGPSAWSFPRAPYVAGPRIATPQPYMPAVVLYPPQGALPAPHGWSTYVGNLSPVSSPSILGSNLMYNSRSQMELANNGQVHLPSSPNLPQRPEQPDCRYYMKSGTCKYGAECKYHHPKERITESPSNLVGLPSRPGQLVCSNYLTYGTCKFGPTCRFDHPFMEQSVNYSYGMPMLVDSSTLSYPQSWNAPQGFESTPSSESSKYPDRGKKTENENYKNSETKVPEESPEQAADSLPPSPSSSETVQDQSS